MSAAILVFLMACGNDGHDGRIQHDGNGSVLRLDGPVLVIGKDDSVAGHLLHRVTGVLGIRDDRIVVANSGTSQIRVFEDTGLLLTEFGGQGGGPGEFLALRSILSGHADSLLAWDPMAQRLSTWTVTGDYGGSTPIRQERSSDVRGRLDDGRLIIATPHRAVFVGQAQPWQTFTDSLEVSVLDVHAGDRTPIGVFPDVRMVVADASDLGGSRTMRSPIPDGPSAVIATDGHRIVIGSTDSPVLQVFDGSGDRIGEVALPIEARPRPPSSAEAAVDEVLEGVPRMRRPAVRRYLNQFPQPDRYPIFDRVMFDDRARLWVREFVADDREDARWIVLADESSNRTEVFMPARFEAWQIEGNRVLGTMKGTDDIELVVLYELAPI